jgi:tetratricopeptide (TPR) repeat protein
MVPVGDGMVRWAAVVAACVVVVWLGAVQIASSAAYGDLAVRPSLPAMLHDRDPWLLRPLMGGPRARAAAALHNLDTAEARALVAGLPDDAESADLRGRLAESEGDDRAAIDAYVRARDFTRAQGLIEGEIGSKIDRALRDQQRLVAALSADPNASEVTGEAWWRLGQMQATAGYRDLAAQSYYWHEAERSYEHALEIAPNEETYLLAAGYQSLANGDAAASLRFYRRAADVVPNSLDAYVGLAWAAAAANDCASARTSFEHALALHDPRLTAQTTGAFTNPAAGAALRRCVR